MNLEETVDNGVNVLRIAGEADLQGVPELQNVVRKKLDSEQQAPLVIDFEAATFVNTPVWAVIVEGFQSTSKSGQKFAVSGLGGRVKDSFDIVRLGEFVRQFPSVDEAVADLSQSN